MKLKKLLAVHQAHSSSHSLKGNLGDGFLLAKNPLFRNVRHAAKKAGFKFSGERFAHYDSLALTQLPRILESKTIPYCDNVEPLKEIENLRPGFFSVAELPPIRSNYVLHESAHAVARAMRRSSGCKVEGLSKKLKGAELLAQEREFTFGVLFEESFANACESFFCLYGTTEIHNGFIFKNAYILETLATRKLLLAAARLIGAQAAFRMVLLSFLHSNFLQTLVSKPEFDRILRIVFLAGGTSAPKLSRAQKNLLFSAFEAGFDLDLEFTVRTNQFCLKLMGVNSNLKKVLGFDFLSFLESRPENLKCLSVMGKIA